MMGINACSSEFWFENIEAFRVCIPHGVAQRWCLLTMHKLLGIILEMTSGPASCCALLLAESNSNHLKEEQNANKGTLPFFSPDL